MLKKKAMATTAGGDAVEQAEAARQSEATKAGPAHAASARAADRAGDLDDGASRQLAQVILWFFIGLLMPRAGIYGSMFPFGVSFAAAVPGVGALGAYIAALVGYLMPGGAPVPLQYVAALVAVAGIKWALNGIPALSRHTAFAPVIAFLSIEFTGFALGIMNGLELYGALLIVAEGLLAAGTAYFFAIAAELVGGQRLRGALTAQEQASVIMMVAVLLMAAASWSFSGIAPGRIVAGVAVLLLARCGKEQGGSIAGIVVGLALALAEPSRLYLAAAFALGGLTAGVFARFGRFAMGGVFTVSYIITSVASGDSLVVIAGIYEVLAAGVIFVALPSAVDRFINRFFLHAQDIPAVEGLRRSVVMRLDHASAAMNDIAETVDVVSKKLAGLSAPDLGTVYQSVSDDVCRVCGLRMYCWERSFNDTMEAFNHLTPVLRKNGFVRMKDVPARLTKHCSRLDDVITKINAGYVEYNVREGAFRRLAEIRSVVTDQFSGMSELLEELSADFSKTEQVDTDAAIRVTTACEEFGLLVKDAVCLIGRGGHMTVEILALDESIRIPKDRWMAAMSDAAGRELAAPVMTRFQNGIQAFLKITMAEKPLYAVKTGSAQLHCTGERLCGDAFDTFSDGAGRWFAVLSDGMGNGGRAAVDGAMATGLASRLIQAGFGHDSALRLVNSALMVKSGDESLATLDTLEIDLFTGKIDCRKAGASPTLLYSKGRVTRFDRTALPLGILRDIKAEATEDTLVDGDVLLMFSDGAMTGGLEWLEDKLRDFDPSTGELDKLAHTIADAARRRQEAREDDITVLAVQVRKTA